jgi:hypothetical protein
MHNMTLKDNITAYHLTDSFGDCVTYYNTTEEFSPLNDG